MLGYCHNIRCPSFNEMRHGYRVEEASSLDTLIHCAVCNEPLYIDRLTTRKAIAIMLIEKINTALDDVLELLRERNPTYKFIGVISNNSDDWFNISIIGDYNGTSFPVTHLYRVHDRGVSDQTPLSRINSIGVDAKLESILKTTYAIHIS